jgi:uncharacterized protein
MSKLSLFESINIGNKNAVLEVLNESAAELNNIDDSGLCPFTIALQKGFKSIARIILNKPCFDIDQLNAQPLRASIELGYLDFSQELLRKGANPNFSKGNKFPLLIALECEHFDLASQMLECGAEINIRNEQGWTPLIWASIKGRTDIVQFLLAHGADVHICCNDGWNALTGAHFKNRTDIAALLKEKGATFPSKYAEAALLSSFEAGYLDVSEDLVKQGTNVDIADGEGNSLLMKAIIRGDDSFVKLLIEHGLDVNAKDSNGVTALMLLAKTSKVELLELVISAGASVNQKTKKGRTALWFATATNNQPVVSKLVSSGADIDSAKSNGWTSLMLAAQSGIPSCVKLLLDLGANPALKTEKGSTAHDIAISNRPVLSNDENYERYKKTIALLKYS